MLAVTQEEMSDGLPSLSTTAARAGNNRDVSPEEVVKAYLLGLQPDQQRVFPFVEPFVELQHFLGRRWRVSVCRAASLVFPPCAN